MFAITTMKHTVPIMPKHLRDQDEEISAALPWSVRGVTLEGGLVSVSPQRWSRSKYGVQQSGTSQISVPTRVEVLATALEAGTVLDVLDVRKDAAGAYRGEAAGAVVRLTDLPDMCPHGSSAMVVGRARARLVSHDPRSGEWTATVAGPYLGLHCCWVVDG